MIFKKRAPLPKSHALKPSSGSVLLFNNKPPAQNVQASSLRSLTGLNSAYGWHSLPSLDTPPSLLFQNGLFLGAAQATKSAPVLNAFDQLRSRILKVMIKNSWRRLAITAPSRHCGTSFIAANLALGLSRLPSCRTILIDLNLQNPRLAHMFDQPQAPALAQFLSTDAELQHHFLRFGTNLVLGLNGKPHPCSAALLNHQHFATALDELETILTPDVVVFDMPPILEADDLITCSGQMDAVLMVVDGTHSRPQDIACAQKLVGEHLPILGVFLNRAQDSNLHQHFANQR